MITYSKLDDHPVMTGRPGWVSQLHDNLRVRVAQLSGRQVAVVPHPDSSASAEVEAEVMKQIPSAKTVVSVLSPPFRRSRKMVLAVGHPGSPEVNQPPNCSPFQ